MKRFMKIPFYIFLAVCCISTATGVPRAWSKPVKAGALSVTISPQGVVDAGAQWKRTTESIWNDSGYTETGIPVGTYTIEYKTVTGWDTPANESVTIENRVTTYTNATYISQDPQTGSLTISISPQGAVDAGAQWKRTTESVWNDSGVTETDIPAGTYTVEFKTVSGWDTPASQDITISAGQTSVSDATYTEQIVSSRPDFRVMGYNIMQLPVQDWDQDQRLAHLPDALRALTDQPDVIAYSEVLTDDAHNTLASMSDIYPYLTPVVGQVCSGGGWDSISGDCSDAITVVRGGMCIASKWPILEQHAYVFVNSIFGSADYQANKGVVYAKINKNGYIYHVLGTHLQATHDGGADDEHQVRMAQLAEMKTWIDSFGIPADEPLILAGDMNVDFSLTSQINDMLATSNTALNFPNDQGFGSYPEDNWMSRAYNYYFGYDMCYNDTLDYVLTRIDHLMPSTLTAMEVVPLKAQESWYWYYLYGWWDLCSGSYWHDGYTTDLSDHYPVVVTYTYGQ